MQPLPRKKKESKRKKKKMSRVENPVVSRVQACGKSVTTNADEQRLLNQRKFPNSCICFADCWFAYSPPLPPPPSHPPLPQMSHYPKRKNQVGGGWVGSQWFHEYKVLCPGPQAMPTGHRPFPHLIWVKISAFGGQQSSSNPLEPPTWYRRCGGYT